MQEGWWVNYRTGKDFYVKEHETWIRQPGNADKAGVPAEIQKKFSKFKAVQDRDKFLMFLMESCPLMRMRGHGSDITFEYYNSNSRDAIEAVHKAAHDYGGRLSTLNIYNLMSHEMTSIQRDELDRVMDESGVEGVMRAASEKFSLDGSKMIKELLAVAKELAMD
jgi:hypothetical protein